MKKYFTLNNIFFLFLFFLFFIWYGCYRGFFIQFSHSVGLGVSALGYALDVSINNSIFDFNSHSQLIPHGSGMPEMSLYYVVVSLINRLVNNIELSSSIFYTIFYIFSFSFSFAFFLKISRSKYLSLFFTVLFYLHPFFISQAGIIPLECGLLALPINMYCSLLSLDLLQGKRTATFKLFIAEFIAKLLIVSGSWYIAVIAAVAECLFFCFYILLNKRSYKKAISLFLFYVLIPWILSMAIINFTKDNSVPYEKESIEIFRGSGADVVSLIFPPDSVFSAKLYSISDFVNNSKKTFIGDRSTFTGNYLGIGLLLSFILFLWAKFKQKSVSVSNSIVISLGAVACISLLLALGVGLKFNALRDVGPITYQSYLLKEEQVLFDFPWKSLYSIFPLCYMRATYRWIIMTDFALLIFAALFLRDLVAQKRSFLKYFILAILFIDFLPKSFSNTSVRINDLYYKNINEDIIKPLGEIQFKHTDRVVFTMAENDYLAPYFAAKLGFVTYNGSGDKVNHISEQYAPSEINQIKKERSPEKIAELIYQLKNKGLAEYVILPFFSLRWSSYKWPVEEETYSEYKKIADEVLLGLNGNCVRESKYFYVIDLENLEAVIE